MRFNKIGQTILLALSLTAIIIIVATSCSGADATKPEDMKIDLGQELGSGRYITPDLATTNNADNTGRFVLVTGATNHFLSTLMKEPSMTNYRSGNGAGIVVTDILKVLRADDNATPENQDITGVATAVKNDVGGVYRVDLATLDVTNVTIEFSYKLKTITTSTTAPKITHTKIGINTNTTALTSLDLYTEIAGSSEGSLFGKTYVFGASANINATPTRFSNGMITNNILTNLSIPSGGAYKLWIY